MATTSSWFTRDYDEQSLHQRTRNVQYLDQLDRRQTTVKRPGQEDMNYTDTYPSVEPKFYYYRQLIPGEHWNGETTFGPKTSATEKQMSKTSTTTPRTRTRNSKYRQEARKQLQEENFNHSHNTRHQRQTLQPNRTSGREEEQDGSDTIYNHKYFSFLQINPAFTALMLSTSSGSNSVMSQWLAQLTEPQTCETASNNIKLV